MLRGLTDVSPGRHVALVASVGGRDVAVARWISDRRDSSVAEVALSVVDAHQGRGLGRRLLGELAWSARAAGVRELHFFVHPDNDVMLHLLARVGARVVSEDAYGVELRADADAMKSVTTDSMSSRSAASGRW
jgi:GNAT superfamily N-acetyltransferase